MTRYLYIHIPFCLRKCLYCDFYSVPFQAGAVGEYISSLHQELRLNKESARDLRTLYMGGGTPTLLSVEEIAGVMDEARKVFSLDHDAEITIEANPGTLTEAKLKGLRMAGINRISIGVQSLVDPELAVLGRIHKAEHASAAVGDARRAGFGNISVDLIYGVPGQTMKTWEYSLLKAIEGGPEHLSAYELTPERNTPLYGLLERGDIAMPDEELITDMYYLAVDILEERGYEQYEISNYAKPGFACIHNLNYWNRGEYLGIGAGAHSFIRGRRMGNAGDISRYCEALGRNLSPVVEDVEISGDAILEEIIFLGLRKTGGVEISRLPDGERLMKNKAVEELVSHGLVETSGTFLRLTRKGLVLSNEIFLRLFQVYGC